MAVVAVAAAVGGTALLVGSPRNPDRALITPVPATATPSETVVDDSLVFTWVGASRAVPGGEPQGDDTWLDITPTSIELSSRLSNADEVLVQGDASTDDERLLVTARSLDCQVGEVGSYPWSLSQGGIVLTIGRGADDCAERAGLLPGTWYRVNCPWQGPPACLGRLVSGTYPSFNFATGLDGQGDWHPKLGALTYTLPDGWTNSNDYGAGLWLEPTSWHDTLLASMGGRDSLVRDTGEGVYVLGRPVAAYQARDCVTGVQDRSIGETVDDLIAYLLVHPAIAQISDGPQPITVGPLEGQMVDVMLAPSWTQTCPGADGPVAMLFTAKDGSQSTGWGDDGIAAGSVQRLILLDLGDGHPVLIDIMAPSRAEFDEQIPAFMDIVHSFRFLLD